VRRPILVLAACVAYGCSGGSTEPGGNGPDVTPPKAIQVVFAGGTVRAELATLSAQRSTGLMNRASIAADSGMIFVWAADQNPQTTGFFMLNTHFDLDIAFLDANKRVINIDQMTKETLDIHRATAPFRYAVEAPRGWFAAHGVAAGATATFTIPAGVIIDP
jgi:uncharacterized membrane protein (UPF0127 family)